MKYFILRGLLPEASEGAGHFGGGDAEPRSRHKRVERWRSFFEDEGEFPLPREGEHVFLDVKKFGRVLVFVHNVYDALLMVSAASQQKAYALALPFRSYLTVYLGFDLAADTSDFTLYELKAKPAVTSTTRDIAGLCRKFGDSPTILDFVVNAMHSGTLVTDSQIRLACNFVAKTLQFRQLTDCLMHLEQSHTLVAGHMTSSHYYRHYREQRRLESAYLREKKYLEDRTRYDLAFLSGFRALEALLDTMRIKRNEVPHLLRAFDEKFSTSFSSTTWTSYHEVFSSKRKKWKFAEIIGRYLDIRNAVAAHANPQRPYILGEDQVLEIQRLVEHMLDSATGPMSGGAPSSPENVSRMCPAR
jgi:hypothetical protein